VSVRHALLALLSEGPRYGMQLKEEYEGATGDAWPLNVGQVYTTLQRLERDGLSNRTTPQATIGRRTIESPYGAGQSLRTGSLLHRAWNRRPATSSPPRCSWRCAYRAWTSTT